MLALILFGFSFLGYPLWALPHASLCSGVNTILQLLQSEFVLRLRDLVLDVGSIGWTLRLSTFPRFHFTSPLVVGIVTKEYSSLVKRF